MITRLFDLDRARARVWLGLGLIGAVALVVYVMVAGMPAMREAALMVAAPLFCVALALRHSTKLLLILLTIGLSFSARYRPMGFGFHQGGAELSIAPLDLPLLGLIALAAFRARWSGSWRRVVAAIRPLSWTLAFFLGLHLLSVLTAADRGLALLELLRLFKMIALVLILIRYISSPKSLHLVTTCLLIAAIAQGGLACAQWASGESLGLGFLGEHGFWEVSDRSGSVGRAGGTLGHANSLSYFLGLLTPLALSFVLAPASRGRRALAALATLSGVVGVFVTFSRAAWLALPVGLAVVLALSLRWRRAALRRLVPALLVALALLLTAAALNADLIALRFNRVWSTSVRFRVNTFRTALNMVRARPLLGVGANNYEAVSDAYLPPDDGSFKPENARVIVHNIFLLYAAELGLPGLAAFALILLSLLRLAWKLARSAGEPGSVGLGVLGGIVTLLVQGQLGWLFRYDPIFTLFWFMAGLSLAAERIRTSGQDRDSLASQPAA